MMKSLKESLPDLPKANCRNADPDIFHMIDKRDRVPPPETLKYCNPCGHRTDCLKWALDHGEKGVWGGTTEFQRAALLREIHRVKCPGCGSYDIYTFKEEAKEEFCTSCGLSWLS